MRKRFWKGQKVQKSILGSSPCEGSFGNSETKTKVVYKEITGTKATTPKICPGFESRLWFL
jgi:hypothetical protein